MRVVRCTTTVTVQSFEPVDKFTRRNLWGFDYSIITLKVARQSRGVYPRHTGNLITTCGRFFWLSLSVPSPPAFQITYVFFQPSFKVFLAALLWRSLHSPMSSCGFYWIPSGKLEFCRIPWNFNGKHFAGAPAILVYNSMEIPTFFWGILTEIVGIQEPPGVIPNGIPWTPLEFCWNSMGNSTSAKCQYFTLLHEFWQIPPESHRTLEFGWESTRMVGMYNSPGNSYGFPVEFEWNFHGTYTQIPEWFQVEFEWNSDDF